MTERPYCFEEETMKYATITKFVGQKVKDKLNFHEQSLCSNS